MSARVEIRLYYRKGKPLHYDATTAQIFIRFLEADEYFFGSGYLKEFAWRKLRRFPLTERQKDQLREVAVALLHKRIQREFRFMATTMYGLADEAFCVRVAALAEQASDEDVRTRAALLAAYLTDIARGRRAQDELKRHCSLSYRRVIR